MAKPVLVTITGEKAGTWQLTPFAYGPGLGLQHSSTGAFIRYTVPIYTVTVDGGRNFKAIRFGLVNKKQDPPPAARTCDAGLSAPRTVTPSWLPSYSPHSFRTAARPGAWRLIENKGFLIHEGTADPKKAAGGSLGCVEIVGPGEWNAFLAQLESLAGDTCSGIGASKALTVAIEAAPYPIAKLV